MEEIHLKELLNLKQGAQRTARAPKYGPLEEGGSPWVLGVWGAPWGAGGMRKHVAVSMAVSSTQDCTRVTAYFDASFLETRCVDITVAAATPHHASPPPPPRLFLMIQ